MAGYVHEGDHALIARDCEEVRPRWCGVVHALKTLPAPQSASSIQQPNTRQDHVALLILFAHKAEKTIPSANCAKSCRLREYTRLEEMLSRFESNGFVSQGFDKPRRAPRTQDFCRVCSRAAPDEGGAPCWGQRLVHLSGISAGAIDRSIPSLGCQGASVWRALARQLASFHARKHGYAPGWLAARRRKRSRLAADVLSFSHAALLQRLGAHVEAQRSGP